MLLSAQIRTSARVFSVLVILVFSFTPPVCATDTVVSTATREGRLAVFDDVWETIDRRYYDSKFNGLDWEAQRITFRALAAETKSADELYAILRRMIARLDDPHTRVYSPEEKFDWWRPRFISVGLSIRPVSGLPTVVHVERGSAPDHARVQVGDVIVSIDGEPAVDKVSKRLNDQNQSASSRSRAFATLMDGPVGSIVNVTWQRKDGKQKSGRFIRYWHQRDYTAEVRREKGEIAVVQIDAFTQPLARQLTTLLRDKLKGAKAVILDLRNNAGGDAQAMADIASAFLGPGFDLGDFTDRSGMQFSILTRLRSPLTAQSPTQTQLPVVVLTSERTASAAEIFIAALKSAKRASVIGTQTCGCVLAIRTRHTLPDGGILDVSELDFETAAGVRLEKNGVLPDETVVIERTDLYSKRDRTLDAAITRLTQARASLN